MCEQQNAPAYPSQCWLLCLDVSLLELVSVSSSVESQVGSESITDKLQRSRNKYKFVYLQNGLLYQMDSENNQHKHDKNNLFAKIANEDFIILEKLERLK